MNDIVFEGSNSLSSRKGNIMAIGTAVLHHILLGKELPKIIYKPFNKEYKLDVLSNAISIKWTLADIEEACRQTHGDLWQKHYDKKLLLDALYALPDIHNAEYGITWTTLFNSIESCYKAPRRLNWTDLKQYIPLHKDFSSFTENTRYIDIVHDKTSIEFDSYYRDKPACVMTVFKNDKESIYVRPGYLNDKFAIGRIALGKEYDSFYDTFYLTD